MDVPQEIKIISQIGQENFKHAIWHTQIEGVVHTGYYYF
jgi:hypothetical protein